MKTEQLPLIVALVAAAATLTGVILSQRGSLELERQKWQQSRADLALKNLHSSVVDYARDLAAGRQEIELLVWFAQNDPSYLSQASFTAYYQYSKVALSRIAAHRVVVAAQEPGVEKRLERVTNAYYRADECVANAGKAFRANAMQGRTALAACSDLSRPASSSIVQEFSAALVVASGK